VLAILVQPRRDKRAATKFLHKVRKGLTSVPHVALSDKRASDGAALRAVIQCRAPTTEGAAQPRGACPLVHVHGGKDQGHARRFLVAYGPIASHCRPHRHRLTAEAYRSTSAEHCATRGAVTGTTPLV